MQRGCELDSMVIMKSHVPLLKAGKGAGCKAGRGSQLRLGQPLKNPQVGKTALIDRNHNNIFHLDLERGHGASQGVDLRRRVITLPRTNCANTEVRIPREVGARNSSSFARPAKEVGTKTANDLTAHPSPKLVLSLVTRTQFAPTPPKPQNDDVLL